MDTLKFAYRYISGDMNGAVGKINQYNDTYAPSGLNNLPDITTTLSEKLLNAVDSTPIAKFSGSVGTIYTSSYKNNIIAIKTVTKEKKEIVMSDLNAMKTMIRSRLIRGPVLTNIYNSLKQELDMDIEFKSSLILNDKLKNNNYGFEFLNPINELCSKNEFVYHYVEGNPIMSVINDDNKYDIARRLVLFYFDTVFNKCILLGDINERNILYNNDTNKLTLIDYGTIDIINEEQKKFLLNHCKNQRKSKAEFIGYLMDVWNTTYSYGCQIFKQARPFADVSNKKYDFSRISTDINFYNNRNVKIPNNIIMVMRSYTQLINILKKMKIKDNYTKDLEYLFI